MNTDLKNILHAAIRVIVYGLVIIGSIMVIYYDGNGPVDVLGYKFTDENSYTEYLQELMLFVTSLLFIWAGVKNRGVQGFTTLMAGIALIALIRELDLQLNLIVHGFWKYPAFLVLIITAYLVYRKKDTLFSGISDFLKKPSWGVMLSGFLTVFVFSRLFGKKTFWMALMDDGYMRTVKNAAEEGTELLGYTLIAIAAVEYLISALKKGKS